MAEEWRNWLQRYGIFITAVEGHKKSDSMQMAIFLSCIREEALQIFNAFTMTEDVRNKIEAVRQKFMKYSTLLEHQIFEWHQFWWLQQHKAKGLVQL